MLLETSQDLLNIVLAIAILWITFFLCAALYYLTSLLRHTNKLVKDFELRVARLEMAIHHIKDKLENSASYLALIAEGGKQLVSFLMERQAGKKKGKK